MKNLLAMAAAVIIGFTINIDHAEAKRRTANPAQALLDGADRRSRRRSRPRRTGIALRFR